MTGTLGDQQTLGDRLPAHDFTRTQGRPRPDHRFPVRPDSTFLVDELVEPADGWHIRGRDVHIHVFTFMTSRSSSQLGHAV